MEVGLQKLNTYKLKSGIEKTAWLLSAGTAFSPKNERVRCKEDGKSGRVLAEHPFFLGSPPRGMLGALLLLGALLPGGDTAEPEHGGPLRPYEHHGAVPGSFSPFWG